MKEVHIALITFAVFIISLILMLITKSAIFMIFILIIVAFSLWRMTIILNKR